VPLEASPTLAQPSDTPAVLPAETPTQPPPTATQRAAPPTQAPTTDPTSTPPATATTGLQCTVLQNLNLRPGPGTAYRPLITTLLKDTVVIPIAYNPVGIPGGSWVQVRDDAENLTGWVSAGSQFVSCTIDLTTLGSVSVDLPSPPPPPGSVQSSDGEGNCDPPFECVVTRSDQSFIQFALKKDGETLTQNTDIKVTGVQFNVTKDGVQVYTRTEANSAYCIFGGDGPCTGWTLENFVYEWPNGERVENAKYFVEILAFLENDPDNNTQIRWAAEFTVNLP
jgi:hypothetical protein